MKIRFQADASLHPAIGRGLVRRESAIDWRPSGGVIADCTPDTEVLRLAADAGRVVVTVDVSTMLGHFVTFTAKRWSPGLILVPPSLPIGEIIDRLRSVWLSSTADDIANQAWWLER